jgi:hypothetical protein
MVSIKVPIKTRTLIVIHSAVIHVSKAVGVGHAGAVMGVVAWVSRESELSLGGSSRGSETSAILIHSKRQVLVLTPFVRSS